MQLQKHQGRGKEENTNLSSVGQPLLIFDKQTRPSSDLMPLAVFYCEQKISLILHPFGFSLSELSWELI